MFASVWFQDNPMENLNTAFDVAEKHLDIPRMLDPEGEWSNYKLCSVSCGLHLDLKNLGGLLARWKVESVFVTNNRTKKAENIVSFSVI
jgi:hypothetical protein